ncbi:DUF3592 domain-containing protein [Corynebacterium yudongzhengii]|uniref:DUF3592 domain-containing protein n=1 Tax=Corynebacterium yudongzhengii TaxID=2080740 RepID=A0A2U1TAB0_9CORY|nr:DUF3592 domain-containing protein [Corynebacterium yudongzhengii]AWB82909.1 DUF3592 domain-containing protein [Corynebacterium yudongzhengii]PWC02838.1 DUF3592 domain-containing protein [Corynebacterium yudongzhengii]
MPGRNTVRRRLHQLVLALLACALLGSFAMVGGAALNDREIHSHPGRAMATVTGQSWFRTTVDYQDDQGVYHAPPAGLLYPTGLGEGQSVWVTYARHNPDLVKVEGRGWTLAIIPALSVAFVSVVIAAVAWWVITIATRPRKGVSSSRVTKEDALS